MLKLLWITCHSTCVASFLLVCLHSHHWYIACAWAIFATYALSVARHLGRIISDSKLSHVPLAELLESESVVLLGAAYLLLTTPSSPIKLVSLVIYSLLNLAWYVLHEAARPTPLRWTLIELLRSTEPFLLTVASGTEWVVLACYCVHYYQGLTPLTPVVCLMWISLKRLVHSSLARLLFHHVVDTIVASCACVPLAPSAARFLVVLQRFLYFLVPVGVDFSSDAPKELEQAVSAEEPLRQFSDPAKGASTRIIPPHSDLSESNVRKKIKAFQNSGNDVFLNPNPLLKCSVNKVFLLPANTRKDCKNTSAEYKPNHVEKDAYHVLRDPGLEEEFLSRGFPRPRKIDSSFLGRA